MINNNTPKLMDLQKKDHKQMVYYFLLNNKYGSLFARNMV